MESLISVNNTKNSAIAKKILAHFIFSGRYSSCLGYSEVITIKSTQECGTAEIVIPPNSSLINQSARDVWLRKTYGIAMVALHRGGNTLQEGEGILLITPDKIIPKAPVISAMESLISVNNTKNSAIAKKILAHFIFSGRYSSGGTTSWR
jgi:hypothetical protein